jgi:hypothetical protein
MGTEHNFKSLIVLRIQVFKLGDGQSGCPCHSLSALHPSSGPFNRVPDSCATYSLILASPQISRGIRGFSEPTLSTMPSTDITTCLYGTKHSLANRTYRSDRDSVVLRGSEAAVKKEQGILSRLGGARLSMFCET